MSSNQSWSYWGNKRKWEDPLLHVLEFPQDTHVKKHFEETFRTFPEEGQKAKVVEVLQNILRSMGGFERDIGYCLGLLSDNAGTERQPAAIEEGTRSASEPRWQSRLGPLQRCVIRQYLKLFRIFCSWAADKWSTKAKGQCDEVHGTIKAVVAKIEWTTSELENPAFEIQIQCAAYQGLKDDLEFLEDKWISRSVREITFLIRQCKRNDMGQQNLDLPRLEQEKQSLRCSLEDLQTEEYWTTTKDEVAEFCVPRVICFNETSQSIGATKPQWPAKFNPWRFDEFGDFLAASRDSRISPEIREKDFGPASQAFNELALETFRDGVGSEPVMKGLFASTPEAKDNRTKFHTDFGSRYTGPLRSYEQNVWQAIDGCTFEYKDQCVRCQIYWNAVLVNPNSQKGSPDFESSSRKATCAESCLHAEQVART
ncbi:MAG: hypothetical protein M1820_003871 [Bogoriella megaspora]|nr:MAG: hypothetical protein M1820_003871 [Bogoriella megaspora]